MHRELLDYLGRWLLPRDMEIVHFMLDNMGILGVGVPTPLRWSQAATKALSKKVTVADLRSLGVRLAKVWEALLPLQDSTIGVHWAAVNRLMMWFVASFEPTNGDPNGGGPFASEPPTAGR
jgi:hypothetical protein